jgi:CubicO group peptidase (beta-lactamase class C family)
MNVITRRRVLLLMLGVAAVALVLLVARMYGRQQPATLRAATAGYEPRELIAGGHQPPAPHMQPQSEQLDPEGLEAAAAYAGSHGSLALIVSRHGYIVFERYWHGTTFETLTDGGSFTALLAALATGVAMSHRMIGWPDEPIGAFIGEWAQDPRGAITVRNLMQMSSGLRPRAGAGSGDLLAWTLAAPLAYPPGTSHLEQPIDLQVLSLVIERATRQRYASYLSQILWRRLGAGDAWLWLDHAQGSAHAYCCMVARQGDWIRLAELLLREGNYQGAEIVRPGWVTLLRAPTKADPNYGASLHLAGRPASQQPYAMPDLFVVGEERGNRLWLVPSLQIAILATAPKSARDADWDDSRVPNLVIGAARDNVRPGPPPADVSSMVPGHRP